MRWRGNYRGALLASLLALTSIYLLFAIAGYTVVEVFDEPQFDTSEAQCHFSDESNHAAQAWA